LFSSTKKVAGAAPCAIQEWRARALTMSLSRHFLRSGLAVGETSLENTAQLGRYALNGVIKVKNKNLIKPYK